MHFLFIFNKNKTALCFKIHESKKKNDDVGIYEEGVFHCKTTLLRSRQIEEQIKHICIKKILHFMKI